MMKDRILAGVTKERAAAGPKYRVLRGVILDAITSGECVSGTRLPTEVELSTILPFSLGTIQKAYGQLVKEGLVVRTRGRGSFVAPADRQMAEPWHCRFLANDGTILPVYPRLVGHQPVRSEKRWTVLFGAGVKLLRIDRAISINREFEVFSRFFSPETTAKRLLNLPPKSADGANFKIVLIGELGMPISRIVQTVVRTDKCPSRKLRWRPRLLLEATAYIADGEVAYFQEIYIPDVGNKLLFDSDLAR
jgi:GntR family transcriptional regulator